jgi:hypothetical protein
VSSKKIKIRLESWYWGSYEWSNSYIAKKNGWAIGKTAHGYKFEEYLEEKHGWHNSEEFKNGQLIPKRFE